MLRNVSGRKAAALFAFFFVLVAHAKPEESTLAVGDWVFRSGTGRESALIRHLSASEWSHMGVVVAISPDVQIVHATTNDQPEAENQVIISSYREFSAPHLAGKIAAARPAFLSAEERVRLAQAVQTEVGKAFVLVARDRQPRYCTTIIFDALQVLRPALEVRWRRTSLPFLEGEYLYPQALAELSGLQWLP